MNPQVSVFSEKGSVWEHRKIFPEGVCLVVSGRNGAAASGALQDLCAALEDREIEWVHYDGISSNPTVASCREAGLLGREKNASFVVGIGGGSALDASKAAAVYAANPDLDEDALYRKGWPNDPLPVYLIGTTAGTGSEVTSISVLTDAAGRKRSIYDPKIYARAAFSEPKYLMSMPREAALSAGIDALCHCVESAFNKKANDVSAGFAARGVEKLRGPLAMLAAGKTLREKDWAQLYEGSILGGRAIDVTGTCFPHNVGYYFTENYHVPHGFACAMFLEDFLRHAEKTDPAGLAAFLERAGASMEELCRLPGRVLPAYSFALTEEAVDAALPRWENNGSILNTVGCFTTKEIREILTRYIEKKD